MEINDYGFGSMTVNGKKYNGDLIVFPDRIKSEWWRKEGHSLSIEDLDEVLAYEPEVLVIGQGYFSCMKIPRNTQEILKREKFRVFESKTGAAWKVFNEEMKKGKKVVGAFHLTC